jgi:hypothetical protein
MEHKRYLGPDSWLIPRRDIKNGPVDESTFLEYDCWEAEVSSSEPGDLNEGGVMK